VGAVGLSEDGNTLVVGAAALGGGPEDEGFLIALDARNDIELAGEDRIADQEREKWRIMTDGPLWGGVTVVDDVAYFGSMSGTLYAVDVSDDPAYDGTPASRVLWQFDAGGAIASPPLVENGKIYFGTFGETFYALDIDARAADNSESSLDVASEWSFETKDWVWATPLIHNDVLYATTISGAVFAMDLSNGQQKWKAQAGNEVVAQPVVIESNRGEALAVPSGEEDVYVVLLSNGEVTGLFDTNGKGVKSSPVLGDGVLYAFSDNGSLRTFQVSSLGVLSCVETSGEGKRCD
jgi:outer membrane protein assembly factor BamB